MVDKLIKIIKNDSNKHNIDRFCLLSSYIFNQCLPISEIDEGYLFHVNFYLLHVWIKYNNKTYDISFMHCLRKNGIKHLRYQLSIEEPKHLENMDDNYEDFYTTSQNFERKAYYNNAPHNIERKYNTYSYKCMYILV